MVRKITIVILWINDTVTVFDQSGEEMVEFQGRHEDVREAILAHSTDATKFYKGEWNEDGTMKELDNF